MYGAFLLFENEFIHVVAITFTSLILTELLMVALTIRTWHYLMIVAELFSIAVYVLSLVVLQNYFGKSFIALFFAFIFFRKTCPCNIYPLIPHFYIVKLGFTGVYLFFLFLVQNIDCGYSLELCFVHHY